MINLTNVRPKMMDFKLVKLKLKLVFEIAALI